ncbi:MAG: helix-turn-helix transcriptional regulator [Clostridia bacterium]|nr:helix-turn-helix transcriptional regulator [Clostridia bacterium]
MKLNDFVITKFINCFYARDPQGRKKEFENRRFACFIITLKGKISFTSGGNRIYSDTEHAVFLPQGFCYTNECIEDAESIVLNFSTGQLYDESVQLATVPPAVAREYYSSIKQASASLSAQGQMLVFRELYSLAHQLFQEKTKSSAADKILTDAIEYMMSNYYVSTLTVYQVASHCFVSEIYLRKLFAKKYDTTPFKMLTDIRMKKAYLLTKEKRPVKEIALEVGYSAVCQFSRAYKKYYGVPPSEN